LRYRYEFVIGVLVGAMIAALVACIPPPRLPTLRPGAPIEIPTDKTIRGYCALNERCIVWWSADRSYYNIGDYVPGVLCAYHPSQGHAYRNDIWTDPATGLKHWLVLAAPPDCAAPRATFMSAMTLAHSFGILGPPHRHAGICTQNDCRRWLTVDGTVWQGNSIHFAGQLPLVGVLCSLRYRVNGVLRWNTNIAAIGRWGSTGKHPYCQNPKYGGYKPWSLLNP
jgi:hypothetical protein